MSAWDGLEVLVSSSTQADQQGGVLTMAALDNMVDVIKEQASTGDGWMFVLSPRMEKRVRYMMRHSELLMQMYRAYPPPRYKIRKCHMRKLQARWHKCRRRIREIERAEFAQEETTKEQTQ